MRAYVPECVCVRERERDVPETHMFICASDKEGEGVGGERGREK